MLLRQTMRQKFDEFNRSGLILIHIVQYILQLLMCQILKELFLSARFDFLMTAIGFALRFVIIVTFLHFVKSFFQFINFNRSRIVVVHGEERLANVHDVAVVEELREQDEHLIMQLISIVTAADVHHDLRVHRVLYHCTAWSFEPGVLLRDSGRHPLRRLALQHPLHKSFGIGTEFIPYKVIESIVAADDLTDEVGLVLAHEGREARQQEVRDDAH